MAKETIKLKKYVDIINEYAAKAVILPGMLIEVASTDNVQAHATASGTVLPMFALEDELQGNGIDDAFAIGDKVQCWVAVRGEEVYAILADGENVAIGAKLVSNGDGYLAAYSADSGEVFAAPQMVVAIALEAKDLSDSSGAESSESPLGLNKRICIRIL